MKSNDAPSFTRARYAFLIQQSANDKYCIFNLIELNVMYVFGPRLQSNYLFFSLSDTNIMNSRIATGVLKLEMFLNFYMARSKMRTHCIGNKVEKSESNLSFIYFTFTLLKAGSAESKRVLMKYSVN